MRYIMIKKINILLVLLLLFVSIGAVSAAEDLNDTVQVSDGLNLGEITSPLEEDVTSDDGEDKELSSPASHKINNANYASYFNSKGDLISSDVKEGDILEISDNFEGKNFVFQKSVNVVGFDEYDLKNCMFTFGGSASGSTISNLNIYNTKDATYGIFLNGVSNCVIQNCFIRNTGSSSYPICIANEAKYNNVTNNVLQTYGITYGHGTRSTPTLLLSGAHYNYIAANDILCDDANGIYLSNFAGGPLKGGDSNFNTIYNNTIKYNVLPTSWAYGIQLMGSNNTVNKNKVIGAYVGITGHEGNIIINNEIINVTGADFNNPDVEVGGAQAIGVSANSIVKNNIIINAKIIASGAGISASDNCIVEDNYIQVTKSGVGINPTGSNIQIKGNTIITESGSVISNGKNQVSNLVIRDNNITSASGIGVYIQKVSSKFLPRNITIVRNSILTGNKYSIDAKDVNSSAYWIIDYNTIINKNAMVLTPEGQYDPSRQAYNFKGTTFNITSQNYGDYIDANGALLSNVDDGDILNFSGDFSNKIIYVNKAVKITGTNPIFYNTTFRVSSGGVWIEKLTIKNNRAERINAWGVLIHNIVGVTVLNCTIDVYDPNAAYAIYVLESEQVDIINNTLSSEGNYLTYTILANNVVDCRIINNTIFTNGTGELYTFEAEHCLEGDSVCTDGNNVCTDGNEVCPDGNSACTDGNEVCPDGSSVCTDGKEVCSDGNTANPGSHVLKEVYRTYGILMAYSSDNIVSGNKVRVTSKLNQTYSTYNSTNSIVGIDLYYNSHNNVFSNNDVYVWGYDNYIYGMGVLGYYTTMIAPEGQGAENNQFINNNIKLNGTYFVTGIIVGSSSENTTLISNVVDAKSTNVAYGITLEVSQKSFIKNNDLTLNSEIIYGIESFDSNDNIINENNFEIKGKQAYGFVISNSKYGEITSNKVLIIISDDEGFTPQNISTKNHDTIVGGNAGIYLRSYSVNNTIEDNNLTITKGYAVIIDDDAINNIISDNYLSAENKIGDSAVNTTANNVVEDNYVYFVVGTFDDVVIKYFENGTFCFITSDDNLNGAKIDFIDGDGMIINTTRISNGQASFEYDFKDYTPAQYIFSVKISKENYKVAQFDNMVTVNDGVLVVSTDNLTGAVARDVQYRAIVKNILGEGVEGIVVDFYVDDEGWYEYVGKATTDKNGIAVLTTKIPKIYAEHPNVLANISNPYYFESANATANLTAYWLTDTSISVNIKVYATGALATLKDKNGNLLANKDISITLNGKTYPVKTDSNGIVSMPAVSRGTYSVSVAFDGDTEYYESDKSAKITVMPAITGNKASTVYYGNTVKYSVRIVGTDGKYVGSGKEVTIKVNGKAYKVFTDKNGYATKSLKLKAGSYTVTSEYNGDKVSNKITFKPTLTAKNVVAKKKAKKVKFSVKLVDKKGKVLKKKKVTFKVKGKKYTAKTNKKGIATVTIKNLKKVGKYTITSSYGGCSISNKITIKK